MPPDRFMKDMMAQLAGWLQCDDHIVKLVSLDAFGKLVLGRAQSRPKFAVLSTQSMLHDAMCAVPTSPPPP